MIKIFQDQVYALLLFQLYVNAIISNVLVDFEMLELFTCKYYKKITVIHTHTHTHTHTFDI
jgi:hypothetical protein